MYEKDFGNSECWLALAGVIALLALVATPFVLAFVGIYR